jgi:hypothetical protein
MSSVHIENVAIPAAMPAPIMKHNMPPMMSRLPSTIANTHHPTIQQRRNAVVNKGIRPT